ncbi:MAG: hypothetical protein UIC64_10135 [Agathobacter sp.]|nr:hypothetical protein [Agathobacter sp.]
MKRRKRVPVLFWMILAIAIVLAILVYVFFPFAAFKKLVALLTVPLVTFVGIFIYGKFLNRR